MAAFALSGLAFPEARAAGMVAGMRWIVLLLLLSGCAAGPDASCRLEKLAELPVRVMGNVPVVTVEINGKPANLVLDTGSDATVLTRVAARRLGIAEGKATQVGAAGGRTSVGTARLEDLLVGGVRIKPLPALLADAPAPPLDGVLGISVLVEFEVELDVPHRRVALYRARPCATAAPDWPGRVIRLPVQQQPGSGHLFVSVAVDGQPLRGMLDSGASNSTLSLQSAEDAGLGHGALERLPAYRGQAINAEGLVVRRAVFKEMRVGADRLERPTLVIAALPVFAGDLLVGEDYLGTRAVWFSFVLGRVFVQAP